MSIATGRAAPTFELPHAPGQKINLADHIGKEKVVLLFFPFAFSPVCSDEMCHLRDDWSKWTGLGATVFGVSVDSPFVTQKFREELNIPFPILSDFNKEAAKAYGVFHEELGDFKGVAKRAAVVIDADGMIAHTWAADVPKTQVPFDEVEAAVRRA